MHTDCAWWEEYVPVRQVNTLELATSTDSDVYWPWSPSMITTLFSFPSIELAALSAQYDNLYYPSPHCETGCQARAANGLRSRARCEGVGSYNVSSRHLESARAQSTLDGLAPARKIGFRRAPTGVRVGSGCEPGRAHHSSAAPPALTLFTSSHLLAALLSLQATLLIQHLQIEVV